MRKLKLSMTWVELAAFRMRDYLGKNTMDTINFIAGRMSSVAIRKGNAKFPKANWKGWEKKLVVEVGVKDNYYPVTLCYFLNGEDVKGETPREQYFMTVYGRELIQELAELVVQQIGTKADRS